MIPTAARGRSFKLLVEKLDSRAILQEFGAIWMRMRLAQYL
jgi:hypothetical protein